MILNKSIIRLIAFALLVILLAGCKASGNRRAPIEERGREGRQSSADDRDSPARKSQASAKKQMLDSGTQLYVVQKGDTLFSIAFEHGLDYREVAEQNNIENPAAIQIGQQIKLIATEEGGGERHRVESKQVSLGTPVVVFKKDQPKVIKLPYSEQAVAQIERMQQESASSGSTAVISIPPVKPVLEAETEADDSLEWGMPTKGKVIGEYSESANRKGVDISGSKGQAVVASAAGKVVYSGSGLRGYGKLVIIKHNKMYLSAYAHNDQILVKEGQSVSKGQKIAEMGNSDADQVKLHFEIRKFGKPVDPAKFLNLSKS